MEDFLLGEEEIIQRVDEYTLYCHYLGYDPDPFTKYTSPYRVDLHPSFGVFHAKRIPNREFAWKDQATGECGDIFTLVKYIYGYSCKRQAIARIASDFSLGPRIAEDPRKIKQKVLQQKDPTEIRCVYRKLKDYDLKWWLRYHIDQALLEMYKVRPISCYWTYPTQSVPKFPPKGLGYDYGIGTHHKLYFPLAEKDFKFRNDLVPERDLEGFSQLRYHTDTLIITKSLKDVMLLRSFDYDAVAPMGEHTVVHEEFLRYFESKYQRIYTLFDNDGKHAGEKYPYPLLQVPLASGEKDPTDYCKRYGAASTRELLSQLIP